ncbi:hypothetical protein PHISP_00828 [Aspergillus sp. HF37]|nr:hypothetical protein PHISP_00828 [Aspergillus sp. HF37]
MGSMNEDRLESPRENPVRRTATQELEIHGQGDLLSRNQPAPSAANEDQGEPANGISTIVLQKKVASGKDALDILFDAAVQEKEPPASSEATVMDMTPPETSSTYSDSVRQNVSDVDVLRIWRGCRFVKGGWFTAHEAVLLMDRFFQNMAPVSPIMTDFFASHRTHYWLLTQEPVLCCTILMISSRYHTPPGPFGASRGWFIHYRLWQHCQHLILRIVLGQEKLSKAKTRHLGTVEALLLLSEWYPRALHFPPESDGWDSDLMYTAPNQQDPPPPTEESPMQDRWKEDVVEPTRRSDQMSWMLVSSALALAHELGVFDQQDRSGVASARPANPDVRNYLQQLDFRRKRMPSLLFVISNLLSSRIGCTSLMPYCELPSLDSLLLVNPQWTNLMKSWVDLTKLTQTVREKVFSKSNYFGRRHVDFEPLEQLGAQLARWKQNHQEIGNPRYDDIIHIEYEYLRVFANSLGVQAIAERVLSDTAPQGTIDAVFVSRARQINISRNEYDYIEEVVDSACAILARIVSLGHEKPLQYLPIRVFLRMISSSIFLLKALALGVRSTKLQESLDLLDQTIAALQSDQLDDIHLVSRYAALLKIQVSRLRQTLASVGRRNDSTPQQTHGTDGIDHPANEQNASDPDNNEWFAQANHPEDWLSLPLDPLTAPFGSWNDGAADLETDWGHLDLDFIWNLPP